MSREMDLLDAKVRCLSEHAWDSEVRWHDIDAWRSNFTGEFMEVDDERVHAMFALSKFIYFGKPLIREMLRSLYRDYYESPQLQRIRRSAGGTRDSEVIRSLYRQKLKTTRFIGVGNPSESGAHLLYFFRQVNNLPKDLFVDFHRAFVPQNSRDAAHAGAISFIPRDGDVSSYVFFDDLVGSGTQVSDYLLKELASLRKGSPNLEFSFLCLFATKSGIEKLNKPSLFNGRASALFELDSSFKAFEDESRYFKNSPSWFRAADAKLMLSSYGERLYPGRGLGFKDGQLLLGFSHNTPDNVPAAFWSKGDDGNWIPVFLRYDKNYGELA